MKTGRLFDTITVKTLTTSVATGDASESWSAGTQVRADVKQIDGTRYLMAGELVDREVYEISLWDASYSPNIKIEFEGKTLYPIRPVMRNPDKSYRKIVTIIAATKV
jgi:hypothetical protein